MVVRKRSRSSAAIRIVSMLALAGALVAAAVGAARALGGPAATLPVASVLDRGRDEEGVWRSAEDCERASLQGKRLPRAPASVRLASWNIRWFPDNTKDPDDAPEYGTNLDWLSCAVAYLDADVLAVQEFRTHERGRKQIRRLLERLDARTKGHWRLELDRCGGDDGDSHVGFLYDSHRATLERAPRLESVTRDWGCGGDFDRGFARYFRFPSGLDAHLVALHLQWGTAERQITRRRRAYDRIGEVWANLQKIVPDPDVVFLGDFNTSGCNDCMPGLTSPGEVLELDRKLGKRNPRFRLLDGRPGCTEYYDNEATPIDHIAVHGGMAEVPAHSVVETYGPCRALACRGLDGKHERSPFVSSLEQLSDHCPIVLTIPDRDAD